MGACLRFLFRTGREGLFWNALEGAIAFLGALFASDLIPTAPNTVTRHVGREVIRTTARHYQHPYFAAFAATLALVTLHEGFRAVRKARTSK